MKNWIKLIIVLIVCMIGVASVYVWKFGIPSFLSREERYVSSIYNLLVLEDGVEAKLQEKSIIFTYREEDENIQTLQFDADNGILSTVAYDSAISEKFRDLAIKSVFLAAVKQNEQSEENAIYSLISDVIVDKTLDNDGYSLAYQNGVTRFSMKINQKLNLANGQDVYIKATDLEKVEDVIKYKLQNKIIEKPGIVFEKAVSYSDKLVYIIYEKEKLTDRTYNSFMSLVNTVIKDKAEYVKLNYPSITRNGTVILDGITISLNERINENSVHTYNVPDGYEYMVVRIDINEVER